MTPPSIDAWRCLTTRIRHCLSACCHGLKLRPNTTYLNGRPALGPSEAAATMFYVLTLRTIYDYVLAQQGSLHVAFIDYSAAFDSVGHKFLERTLHRAGASAKTRALFRAIYSSANAVTAVSDIDGQTVLSDSFYIRRGVVQGDITSPVYFILALELILELHDRHPSKGVDFGPRVV